MSNQRIGYLGDVLHASFSGVLVLELCEKAGPVVRPFVFSKALAHPSFTTPPDRQQGNGTCGETTIPQASQRGTKVIPMGDKSPKSNQKKSSQKASQASSADQKKKQAVAAKQSANKKK